MFVLIYPFASQLFRKTSCKDSKDLLTTKKMEMTFYSIIESISHLGKMARTSAKSENPDDIMQRFTYNEKNRDDLLQYNGINFTSRKNGSNFR